MAGDIKRIYTEISSQPGRMLNDFRHLGFNQLRAIVLGQKNLWLSLQQSLFCNLLSLNQYLAQVRPGDPFRFVLRRNRGPNAAP
jgi:hypothetical protein